MKEVISPVLAFAVILIIGCTNSKKADVKNPSVGAWEHMSTTFLIHYFNGEKHDTTIVVPATGPPVVKILTKKHYAQGRQTVKNEAVAGGGEYTHAGNSVIKFPKYQSTNKAVVGKSSLFKSKIEGDLWTFARDTIFKNDTVQWQRSEIWKRIVE